MGENILYMCNHCKKMHKFPKSVLENVPETLDGDYVIKVDCSRGSCGLYFKNTADLKSGFPTIVRSLDRLEAMIADEKVSPESVN
ncbi:MAG: hypothetical protein JW791_01575 [Nanoarchaeota archaeon]|nr:hypothetical protein [Nanoarchaeota archaeon]